MTIPTHAKTVDNLTRADIEALGLYAMLVGLTGRGGTRLSREIYRGTVDSRRLFRGAQRQRIIERDTREDGTVCCHYCGATITGDKGDLIFIDHVIPWVHGGQTVDDNAVLACTTCNSSKGAKIW